MVHISLGKKNEIPTVTVFSPRSIELYSFNELGDLLLISFNTVRIYSVLSNNNLPLKSIQLNHCRLPPTSIPGNFLFIRHYPMPCNTCNQSQPSLEMFQLQSKLGFYSFYSPKTFKKIVSRCRQSKTSDSHGPPSAWQCAWGSPPTFHPPGCNSEPHRHTGNGDSSFIKQVWD